MLSFFCMATATTEIYTLSLHDALPIFAQYADLPRPFRRYQVAPVWRYDKPGRSEEHTSELQSRQYLVCRLLLEKKEERAGAGVHAIAVAAANAIPSLPREREHAEHRRW